MKQPDIDICNDCGEHADFDEDGLSNCCGSGPICTDPDIDLELLSVPQTQTVH